MSYAIACVSIVFFAIAFRAVGVLPVAWEAMGRVRRTVVVLADGNQSDDSKERAAREAAIALFGSFFTILALSAVALVPAALAVTLGIVLGIADETSLISALLSPWLAGAACVAFAASYMIRR
jgi:predicted cation transporter